MDATGPNTTHLHTSETFSSNVQRDSTRRSHNQQDPTRKSLVKMSSNPFKGGVHIICFIYNVS
uniref:Uncharacterized protein n=1 Tax=Anguilla anguilla TaxID=7936 RepID=A0A0E9TDV4_ANGAN